MKKILSLFVVCFATAVGFAQIQVNSTGSVAVGDTLSRDVKLFVNTNGSRGTGIYSLIESVKSNAVAILGEVTGAMDSQVAVMGRAANYQSNTGRSVGVLG